MKAWELLEQKGWCQGAYAKDCAGKRVKPFSKSACRFCILGALDKIYDLSSIAGREAQNALYQHAIPQEIGIAEWNDTRGRTKAEVIEALKRADV